MTSNVNKNSIVMCKMLMGCNRNVSDIINNDFMIMFCNFSPDEHYWSTLNTLSVNPQLNTPGGYTGKILIKKHHGHSVSESPTQHTW